jgi:8-oxo-dGTP diphosphatase
MGKVVAIPLELDFRPVLKFDGKSLMGSGRARFLQLIAETGSLSTAAKRMGMSYRHAWGIIQRMEQIYGEEIVVSERGGSEKGMTRLTEAGQKILWTFEDSVSGLPKSPETIRKNPRLTADGIVVSGSKILLVRRKFDPFEGRYALPGGFVEYGERVDECIIREVQEETGLIVSVDRLLGVYSAPDRDPRGHTVTLAYRLNLKGGTLADSVETKAEWIPLKSIPPLAFDHDAIVADYLRTVKKKRSPPC